ncbi:Uncharacterised protein [uncultured archaeon]|nr:Uncharacterised protein [uncultured archaeon]
MACNLFVYGAIDGDFDAADSLRTIMSVLEPTSVGVEETPSDIYDLMQLAKESDAVVRRANELKSKYKVVNSETAGRIAESEIEFCRILADSNELYNSSARKLGARVVGCDSPWFSLSKHKVGISEYSARKDGFLGNLLRLPPDAAEKEIEGAYNKIPSIAGSDELVAYYGARDKDSANEIRRQVNVEEHLEKVTGRDSTFVYFCNISHFVPVYHNLIELLVASNLKPKKARLFDAKELKI